MTLKSTSPTLYFVIPIYNEARNIPGVVESIAKLNKDQPWQIVAINDGSLDDTSHILQACSDIYPDHLHIISHSGNLGIPDALFSGYSKAALLASPGDFIFCIEGDGTSDLQLIPKIVHLLEEGRDIVIASRYRPGGGWVGFPLHRRLISRFGNAILRRLFPYPSVTDFSIFYRGFRAEFLQNIMEKYGQSIFAARHFSANTAMLLACLKEHPNVGETANMYIYYIKKSNSNFNLRKAFEGYTSLILSSRSWTVRQCCLKERTRQKCLEQ